MRQLDRDTDLGRKRWILTVTAADEPGRLREWLDATRSRGGRRCVGWGRAPGRPEVRPFDGLTGPTRRGLGHADPDGRRAACRLLDDLRFAGAGALPQMAAVRDADPAPEVRRDAAEAFDQIDDR